MEVQVLGLRLADEVIEQHGGEIWAESVDRNGTTFILLFLCSV